MVDHDMRKAQERHAALRRESATRRLARLANPARPLHTRPHSRALQRVGRWLVAWGWRLQTRYGGVETIEYRRREA